MLISHAKWILRLGLSAAKVCGNKYHTTSNYNKLYQSRMQGLNDNVYCYSRFLQIFNNQVCNLKVESTESQVTYLNNY